MAAPWAVTAAEKEQLLDRAEAMLVWYRSMEREQRHATPAARFRQQMSPLEIMQAAAILQEKDQGDMSRMVREMLPYFHVTPMECFEIAERLGEATLESFAENKELLDGETVDSVTRIRQEAGKFLEESLLTVEKMALIDEPADKPWGAYDLMKAIDVLTVAGRPVLVRHYLNQFLATEAEPEEFARIAEKIGSRRIMQLASNKNFAPQGGQAAAKIYAEAKKHWTDEGILEEALEDWAGFDDAGNLTPESAAALRVLWKGERLSIPQMIEKLGTIESEKEADELAVAILSFSPDAKEALVASLQSENSTLVAHAARGLAMTTNETWPLYPSLFGSSKLSDGQRDEIKKILERRGQKIPEPPEAAATLFARAKDYYDKNRPLKSDADGMVSFWTWNAAEQKVEYVEMTVPEAYRYFAWNYARQAWQIHPKHSQIRELYLATIFDRAAHSNGLDKPVTPDNKEIGDVTELIDIKLLERILAQSGKDDHDGTATVAAVLLGRLGSTEELLVSDDGRPRILVQATAAKNRRVRFAALEAVMSLKPDTPFPGSSLIAEALTWFAHADGRRVLVSAHPKQTDAAKTAGFFIESGYSGELASNSRDAMQKAVASPDVEMLVIDLACTNPPVPIIVQEMRNDARTHDVPIAVLTDKEKALDSAIDGRSLPTMEKVDLLSSDNPFAVSLSKIYPRIVSSESAKWVNEDLLQKTGTAPVPPELRLEQAQKSLDWIREIVERQQDGPKVFHFENLSDIVAGALRSDVRLQQGLELAVAVKSAGMQAAIYEIVASNVYPMELREKAAAAFEQSIDKFGVLLRGRQVQRLYDRYNGSEAEDQAVQKLLSRMIDVLETKTFEEKPSLL